MWVEDITDPGQKAMWAALKGEEATTLSNKFKDILLCIKSWPSGHNIEIYSVTAVDGIKKSDIIELFNNDPQHGMEVIRENGYKIYSECEEVI